VTNEESVLNADVLIAERAELEGRWVDAVAAWRRLTETRPTHRWMLRYGIAPREVGRWPEAEQALRAALASSARCAESCFQLGLLWRRGQLKHAKEAFRLAVALDRSFPLFRIQLAGLFFEK
jgi:hypothetical protein